VLFAQAKTDVFNTKDDLALSLDTLNAPTFHSEKVDTLKGRMKQRADTLQVKKSRIQQKLDSISRKEKRSQYSHKLDSVESGITSKLDSLNPHNRIIHYTQKIDSIQSGLTLRLDSIAGLNLLDVTRIKGLDSLKNSGPVKDIKNAKQQIANVQADIQKPIDVAENAINEKLGLYAENGANIPGSVNLPDANLKSNLNLPGVKLPGTNLNTSLTGNLTVPDLSLEGTKMLIDPQLPKPEVGLLGETKKQMGKLRGRAKQKLPDVNGMEGVKDVQANLGKVNEISGKVKGYQGDIKNIAEGNLDEVKQLPQEIENKVASLDQVKGIEGQAGQYKELMAKWNSDPAVAKELALNQAKEMAVNHFAGHDEQLKLAMAELSKVKAKQKDAEVVIDLFKKPENEMKGRSFVERLLPGFNLQIQSSTNLWLDFNPFVGYRWSSRWTTGIGWNERLSVHVKDLSFIPNEHAYGPRSYVEFKVRENFHVKAEAEYLNALVTSPYLVNQLEPNGRAWVWSYFAGVKKSFALSKVMKGNVQVLYNLYNPYKRSPYMSQLNIRMGFEFPVKKNTN
jgi:hypothetical protein